MDVAGGTHCFQHIAVLIAGGMGLIGELPLVLPLHKHSAVRICGAFGHSFETCLLPSRQLLFGGVVPPLFGGRRRIIVIIEGLFLMGFSVCVDLCQLIFLFRFAQALMCVPSMNTAAGVSVPALPASSKIQRNTASIVSWVKRCRTL